MTIALDILAAVLLGGAFLLALAGMPTRGGVNANVILLLPAAFVAILAALVVAIRLAI